MRHTTTFQTCTSAHTEELCDAWAHDCMKWRHRVLVGRLAHYCPDWDFLPMDETCTNEISDCDATECPYCGFKP